MLDRDLDFANQYAITKNWYRFGKTEMGRPGNVFGIGPALFELPAFLVGHVAARASGARADGFSAAEVLPSLYMSLLASLGALVPAFLLLRRRLGGALAPVLAPLLVAAAGPVVYYAIRQPGYAHPFATFFVAWLVERWDASFDGGPQARSLGTWSIFGLLVGASALARPQCALWAVLFVAAAVDDARRTAALSPVSRRATARMILVMVAPRWLAGALVAVVVFAPQMLAWKALHGSLVVTPQGPGFMWWGEPAWSEVLFSSRNGLLPWAPLYALAAAGLAVAAFRTPRVGIALVAGVALQSAGQRSGVGLVGGRIVRRAALRLGVHRLRLRAGRAGRRGRALWRERTRRARAGQVAVAAALLVSILLAAANLSLAGRESGPTVRIYGGEAASRIMARKIRGPLGRIAAAASSRPICPRASCSRGATTRRWARTTGLSASTSWASSTRASTASWARRSSRSRSTAPGAPNLVGFAPGPAPKTATHDRRARRGPCRPQPPRPDHVHRARQQRHRGHHRALARRRSSRHRPARRRTGPGPRHDAARPPRRERAGDPRPGRNRPPFARRPGTRARPATDRRIANAKCEGGDAKRQGAKGPVRPTSPVAVPERGARGPPWRLATLRPSRFRGERSVGGRGAATKTHGQDGTTRLPSVSSSSTSSATVAR